MIGASRCAYIPNKKIVVITDRQGDKVYMYDVSGKCVIRHSVQHNDKDLLGSALERTVVCLFVAK